MTRALSPTCFALRQTLAQAAPPVVLAAVLAALWWKFGPPRPPGMAGGAMSLAVMLLFVLVTGGLPVLYLAWWVDLQRKGLVGTPRLPWVLALADGVLDIRTAGASTPIRIADARSLTLVIDDNWDQLKGMEDTCLVIGLPSRLRIIVPGSSAGFDEVLAIIRQDGKMTVRSVE